MEQLRITRHATVRLKERFFDSLSTTPAIRKWNELDSINTDVINEMRRLVSESRRDGRFINNSMFLMNLMEQHGYDNDYEMLVHPTIGAKFLLMTLPNKSRILLTVLGKNMQGEFKKQRKVEQVIVPALVERITRINKQSIFGDSVTFVQNGYQELLDIRTEIITREYQQYINFKDSYRIISYQDMIYCIDYINNTIVIFGSPKSLRLEKWLDTPTQFDETALIEDNIIEIKGDKTLIFCPDTFKVYEQINGLTNKIFNLSA